MKLTLWQEAFINQIADIAKERSRMLQVTTETKAVMDCDRGRVVGFVKSNEPGKVSIAVPNDRAVMTPAQARQLAAWLVEEADKIRPTTATSLSDWSAQEAKRQADIEAALNRDRITTPSGRTFPRRAY
ncbi:hypothetical protein [Streptomyces sp. NPDC046832]|uniref:hypothetical protein n=1 Tax=Streptomyces sp. NPDC046832 TaxID=3155020 RepID=UPI0033F2B29E